MTPLNAIIGTSKIVKIRFRELNQVILNLDPQNKVLNKNLETNDIIVSIQQAGVQMWYYNQN